MSPVPGPYRVTAPDSTAPLRQGEILTNVIRLRVRSDTVQSANPVFDRIDHPFAVVLSQDCDLEQDRRVRFPCPAGVRQASPERVLLRRRAGPGVVRPVIAKLGKKSKAWDRIQQNNDVRYHFLQKVELGCDRLHDGLAELAIDFKRLLHPAHRRSLPPNRIRRGKEAVRLGQPLPGTPEQPVRLLPESRRPAGRSFQRIGAGVSVLRQQVRLIAAGLLATARLLRLALPRRPRQCLLLRALLVQLQQLRQHLVAEVVRPAVAAPRLLPATGAPSARRRPLRSRAGTRRSVAGRSSRRRRGRPGPSPRAARAAARCRASVSFGSWKRL